VRIQSGLWVFPGKSAVAWLFDGAYVGIALAVDLRGHGNVDLARCQIAILLPSSQKSTRSS
jgi:hypothetical protein